MSYANSVAFAFLFSLSSSVSSAQAIETRLTGRYTNVDYGFEVTIPKDLWASRPSAPYPNHGFVIPVSSKTKVWVDAHYDMPDTPYRFSNHDAQLGTIKAERRSWHDNKSGAEMHHKAIVALNREILYTVEFDAEPTRKAEAERVFDALINSFRMIPIRP